MTTEVQEREKAVQMYKILATVLGLLGVGLLTCGIIAVDEGRDEDRDEDDFGLPYFLGGFIVGIMTLVASAICTYIFLKAPDANSEIKKRELGRVIQSHYTLSTFTIMGCFIGCVSAGLGTSSGYDDEENPDSLQETLAKVILIGCIIAIFVTISSLYVISIYGPYFGVVIRSGRHDRRVSIMNTGGTSTMPSALNATTFQMNTQSNDEQIRQLEAQNRLLQQQLQQQQQTQYGFYPPAPPPSYNESVFPPTTVTR